MAEIRIDGLPALGSPAAAVSAIESLLYTALRARAEFSPLQLRYWLDLYYQVRFAHEREELEGRLHRSADFYAPECKAGPPRRGGDEGESTLISQPAADSFPLKGEAFKTPITPEDADRCGELDELLRRTIREQAEKAGIRVVEEPDASSAAQSAAPAPQGEDSEEGNGADVSAPPESASAEDEQEERIAAAPAEPRNDSAEKKPQRHKPVGWTDGFEPTEVKIGPAAQAAKFKREVFERLQQFLREGVTMARIIKAADGCITEDQILAIRECKRVPVAVYRMLQAALDRIETE